ncbi:ribosomal protein L11 methyltransferase [Mariniphaga anaerophila]|uniref:Ribosomal protein L11 methyltransferase n=1 Tax=Mariniphaga anaerophila TaxID=1484053 RepID=A0A1M4VZ67_9BACT|nr:50S ribosomal protein L11 methyltransferase [Mariniphaga anaerophila]SHE74256.1 ribosomal protein L11 methyltransferase [Mariniphaga anaerophila]
MDYYKIEIEITPFEEWLRDVLTAQLGEIGFESFIETETGLEAFIPVENFNETELTKQLNSFNEHFSFRIKKEVIKNQNWNEVWEKNYFKPLVVAGECLVRAPFHTDYPNCKYEIVIEPNMAFGTGNHETTSMMLEAILNEDVSGKEVLDMGCGTGILGILASMKGAAQITAIDIDEWSVSGTQENSARNNIKNLNVFKGDASLLGTKKYDIIFANIHKNILLQDLPSYSASLNPGGKLFMSGFYLNDLDDIKSKARETGLNFASNLEKKNWVVGIFEKP